MIDINVLSLDGGGILGIIPLRILCHIEQETSLPIGQLFKLISGVSTGGITALGLTKPNAKNTGPQYSAETVLKFYKTEASKVFKRTWAGNLCHKTVLSDYIYNAFFSKYSANGAASVFSKLLGETKLSEAITHILIPAYNINKSKDRGPRLKVFSSLKAQQRKNALSPDLSFNLQNDFLMKDLAFATSAAPTYFPPKHICVPSSKDSYCLIDGGVAINDPSLLAYIQACALYPKTNINILSLGVSQSNDGFNKIIKNQSPGLFAWCKKISKLIIIPQISTYQFILGRLLLQNQNKISYVRIQPSRNEAFSDFDDISPEHIALLERTAYQIINRKKKEIDHLIRILISSRQL